MLIVGIAVAGAIGAPYPVSARRLRAGSQLGIAAARNAADQHHGIVRARCSSRVSRSTTASRRRRRRSSAPVSAAPTRPSPRSRTRRFGSPRAASGMPPFATRSRASCFPHSPPRPGSRSPHSERRTRRRAGLGRSDRRVLRGRHRAAADLQHVRNPAGMLREVAGDRRAVRGAVGVGELDHLVVAVLGAIADRPHGRPRRTHAARTPPRPSRSPCRPRRRRRRWATRAARGRR